MSEDENDTSDEEHERLVGHLQVRKIKKPGDICSIKNEHKCVSDDNMITLELLERFACKVSNGYRG